VAESITAVAAAVRRVTIEGRRFKRPAFSIAT
jgi:hypothetical protein